MFRKDGFFNMQQMDKYTYEELTLKYFGPALDKISLSPCKDNQLALLATGSHSLLSAMSVWSLCQTAHLYYPNNPIVEIDASVIFENVQDALDGGVFKGNLVVSATSLNEFANGVYKAVPLLDFSSGLLAVKDDRTFFQRLLHSKPRHNLLDFSGYAVFASVEEVKRHVALLQDVISNGEEDRTQPKTGRPSVAVEKAQTFNKLFPEGKGNNRIKVIEDRVGASYKTITKGLRLLAEENSSEKT